MLDELEKEMLTRRREIVSALEAKFSLEQIQQEFSELGKLKKIEELLVSINTKSSREEADKTLEETHHEVKEIRTLLNKVMEDTKKSIDSSNEKGGFFRNIFGHK